MDHVVAEWFLTEGVQVSVLYIILEMGKEHAEGTKKRW